LLREETERKWPRNVELILERRGEKKATIQHAALIDGFQTKQDKENYFKNENYDDERKERWLEYLFTWNDNHRFGTR
jgi:hypothetical protein